MGSATVAKRQQNRHQLRKEVSSSEEEYDPLASDSLLDNFTNENKSQKGVTAVASFRSLSSKSEQFNEVILDESIENEVEEINVTPKIDFVLP